MSFTYTPSWEFKPCNPLIFLVYLKVDILFLIWKKFEENLSIGFSLIYLIRTSLNCALRGSVHTILTSDPVIILTLFWLIEVLTRVINFFQFEQYLVPKLDGVNLPSKGLLEQSTLIRSHCEHSALMNKAIKTKYVSKICGLNFEIVTIYQIFLIHIPFQSSDRVELDFRGSVIKIAFNFKSQGTEKMELSPKGTTTFRFWEMKLLLLLITNMQIFSSLLCWI